MSIWFMYQNWPYYLIDHADSLLLFVWLRVEACCSCIDTLVSGSPILRNGRIVGAVTRVLVNEPTWGYGILLKICWTRQDINNGRGFCPCHFTFIEQPKSDYRYRTPPDLAPTAFLLAEKSCRMLPLRQCPRSNRLRWRVDTSTFCHPVRREQARKREVLLGSSHPR